MQNQEQAQKFMGANGFMTKEFQKDEADGWKTVQLPKSWTRDDFDFFYLYERTDAMAVKI